VQQKGMPMEPEDRTSRLLLSTRWHGARTSVAIFAGTQLAMLGLCIWAVISLREAASLADAIGFQRPVTLMQQPSGAMDAAEDPFSPIEQRQRLTGTSKLLAALDVGGEYTGPTGRTLRIAPLTCADCRQLLSKMLQDHARYRELLTSASAPLTPQIAAAARRSIAAEKRTLIDDFSKLNILVAADYQSRLHMTSLMIAAAILLSILLFVLLQRRAIKGVTRENQLVERLSLLAVHTNELVIITDAKQRTVWVNRAFSKASGYTLEEVRGRVPGHFLQGAETNAESVATIKTGLHAGEAVHGLEILNYSKDGSRYWVQLDIMPIADAQGKVVQFIALQTNVTKVREERISRAQQARFYAALIETAHDAIVVIDPLGTITLFNPSAERIFGHAAGDMIGKSLDLILPPSQRGSTHAANIHSFDRSQEQSGTMGRRSVSGLRANGEICDLLASISKVEIDGQTRFVAILMDVTLQRQQESIRKARDMAESANHAKSLFLANMSHELRTPLNVVIGFSQVLARVPAVSEVKKTVERVNAIETAGRHLLAMITDILDLAKIDVGALSVLLEPIDLNDSVRSSANQFEAFAAERGITVSVINEAVGVVVLADRTRLRQVLTNLISNAVKYNRKGGQAAVQISTDRASMRALVRIRDTGIGLTTNQLVHMFEPFNRLGAESQAIEGSGIGLALVKRLVGAMQGEISVTSAVGVGTEVLLALPLSGETALPVAGMSVSGVPVLAARTTAQAAEVPVSGNVLYIEDNVLNQDVLRSFVSDWPGLHLTVCNDGRTGLKRATEGAFDLILIDINLPDMNGIDVLHELRRDGLRRGIPCVAVSAVAIPHEVHRATQAGFDGYITKPLDYDHFRATIRSALDR